MGERDTTSATKPQLKEMSSATLFLLVVAVLHFGLSTAQAFFVLGGYVGFAYLDERRRLRRRAKLVDEELFGWQADKEDAEYENRGGLSRIRLTGQNQIIAVRVVEALARLF